MREQLQVICDYPAIKTSIGGATIRSASFPGAIGGPPAIHVGRRYQSLGNGVSGAFNVAGASAGEIRVIADFLTALKCYELLNSHQNIQKDLQKLLASWRSDTWTWFNEFHIDLSIYQVRGQ